MKSKWFVKNKKYDKNMFEEMGVHPWIAKIMANRDVKTKKEINDFLYGTLDDIPSGFLMKDMEKAVDILIRKVMDGRKIRIMGDYDVGATRS